MSNSTPHIDPLRPIVDTIKQELRAELLPVLRAELLQMQSQPAPKRVLLSLADICVRYGIGRIVVKKMIASGQLPAIERECRGGRTGLFIHLADAERVFAGKTHHQRAG